MAKKKTKKKAGGCKRVSRKAAQRKVNGKTVLKKGCRYLKGDGARCCPPGASGKKTKGRKKKRKVTGAAKRARKGVRPQTPGMDRLNEWRRVWKGGDCRTKQEALRALKQQFQHLANKSGGNKKRGETEAQAASRRWARFQAEYRNKVEMTEAFCSGRKRRDIPRSPFPGMVDGLAGRGGKKRHPCATSNPPAWCNR